MLNNKYNLTQPTKLYSQIVPENVYFFAIVSLFNVFFWWQSLIFSKDIYLLWTQSHNQREFHFIITSFEYMNYVIVYFIIMSLLNLTKHITSTITTFTIYMLNTYLPCISFSKWFFQMFTRIYNHTLTQCLFGKSMIDEHIN